MANKRVEYAKSLRKAIQLGLTSVTLESEDYAEIAPLIDPWVPNDKYKKGETVSDGGKVFSCVKNVNKSDVRPADDAEHWVEVNVSEGDTVKAPVWDSESKYKRGDVVTWPEDGPEYSCNKNNTKEEPGTGSDWSLV